MQAADTAASTLSRNEPSRFAAWRLSFVFGQFAMARETRALSIRNCKFKMGGEGFEPPTLSV